MSQKVSRRHIALVAEGQMDKNKAERTDIWSTMIDKIKADFSGKRIKISNSMQKNLSRTFDIQEIRSDYQPGDFYAERSIIFIEGGKEAMRVPVPLEIKVEKGRYILDYSRKEDVSVSIKRTFQSSNKAKNLEDLEIYIEIIS